MFASDMFGNVSLSELGKPWLGSVYFGKERVLSMVPEMLKKHPHSKALGHRSDK